ncbi:hypothetical protein Tco_1353541 [Tanacetum coccineum]
MARTSPDTPVSVVDIVADSSARPSVESNIDPFLAIAGVWVRLTVRFTVQLQLTTTRQSKRCHPSRSPRNVLQGPRRMMPRTRDRQKTRQKSAKRDAFLPTGDVSNNSEKGNSMKVKGFWEAVINYFKKETGSTRGDDTDDEPEYQELDAHYLYMARIQEVTPDVADNSGPIFDTEPLQNVQNDDDNYNVFANEREHHEQHESVNETYPDEQDEHNIIIDSLDMSHDREQDDQDDDDLAKERDLLVSLIEKLKCKINDSKNRNKFLESSNKTLVDNLKGEIENFKTKNKSLESSNDHFKKANNKLSKTNQLMFKDLKKFQAELDRYHNVNYASKVEIDCAKAKGDLMSYKMESQKSLNEHTRKINDLNQMILEMKKELFARQ